MARPVSAGRVCSSPGSSFTLLLTQSPPDTANGRGSTREDEEEEEEVSEEVAEVEADEEEEREDLLRI